MRRYGTKHCFDPTQDESCARMMPRRTLPSTYDEIRLYWFKKTRLYSTIGYVLLFEFKKRYYDNLILLGSGGSIAKNYEIQKRSQ